MIAKGGWNVYGQAIGILMLETKFPRIPGDMGNATTWDFPVVYRIVKGATPVRVIKEADPTLLEPFIEAAKDLENVGVRAITTVCGFLAIFQEEIANAVNIPVFTSSLMQIPLVYRMLRNDQKVGLITGDPASLTKEHLAAVGADSVPMVAVGIKDKELSRVVMNDELTLDVDKVRSDLVMAAHSLVSQHPEVGAIVMECANFPPYARAIQKEIGLPIFDIYTLTNMVYSALVRNDFVGSM